MPVTDVTNATKVKQPPWKKKKELEVIFQWWEEVAGVPDVFKALDY